MTRLTEHHDIELPEEDDLRWHIILNAAFDYLDRQVPQQGSLSNRPTATGYNPPYIVTEPSAEKGVYADVDGSWVLVAAP